MRTSYIILTAKAKQETVRAILRNLPMVHFIGELCSDKLECVSTFYDKQRYPRMHFSAENDVSTGRWTIDAHVDAIPHGGNGDPVLIAKGIAMYPDPEGYVNSDSLRKNVSDIAVLLFRQGIKSFYYDPLNDQFPDGMNTSFLDE